MTKPTTLAEWQELVRRAFVRANRMPDELILSEEETESVRGWLRQAALADQGGHVNARDNAQRMALLVIYQAGQRQFGDRWGTI